ncbi:unnamed protein product [Acanthoscelides obtectus]|uniref:Uncharacterized protein n=1 Tax=Acanthoscelides obtectus TaxID=200917 RepID=A0A9P0L0Y7_ACAOB|nr:unnamed protein product [Acanthoscelides obtectus]CAK1656150.1 hypothetical protein AOBTE_LOCUS19593 [Acanthoscelides obtectus]
MGNHNNPEDYTVDGAEKEVPITQIKQKRANAQKLAKTLRDTGKEYKSPATRLFRQSLLKRDVTGRSARRPEKAVFESVIQIGVKYLNNFMSWGIS